MNKFLAITASTAFTTLTALAGTDTKEMVHLTVDPQPRDAFYAEVNGGAIFFNGPDKDSSNIFTGGAFALGPVFNHPVSSFSTSDTTGSVGGAFGYIFEPKPQNSWLGTNLRAEVGGDYYQTNANGGAQINTAGGGYLAVSRLDGNNSLLAPLIAAGGVGNVGFTSNNEVYDVNAVVKTDYAFGNGTFLATPKFGFSYAHIDQRSSTDVSGTFITPNFSNQEENIGTDYYGGVFGLELKANITKDFSLFLDSTTTLGYASSDYSGHQNYFSGFGPTGGGSDSVSDNKGDFSLREQGNGGFYYVLGPVIFKVSGGVDFWSNVATVREASLSNGANQAVGSTVSPTHLVKSSMVNPQANVSLIIPF